MVKIKTTKIFDLPELIKWAWFNNKSDRTYHSNNDSYIRFDSYGDVVKVYEIEKYDIFKVEVEEDITEETVLPRLLEVYGRYGSNHFNAHVYSNESIANARDNDSVSFHMVHSDGSTTLLWTEEGGMIE